MRQETLIYVFTSDFPCYEQSEPYLWDELPFLAEKFNRVYFVPDKGSAPIRSIPSNCSVIPAPVAFNKKRSIGVYFKVAYWVLSDFTQLVKKKMLGKLLRYNFSLLLQNYSKALYYHEIILQQKEAKVYLYSYWSSDTASVAAFIKSMNPSIFAFSRAHGFDVFEEQTLHHFIFFRKLQLKYLSAIYSVSKRGQLYLQQKNPRYKEKIKCSYLGTEDKGVAPFSGAGFSIATCSLIRSIKRLDLLAAALQYVSFPLTWHMIGDGPDLEQIKLAVKKLPPTVQTIFHGYLNKEQLDFFYKETPVNLLVSMSSSEGLPVSFMEAMSYGIPILSTDVGGCNEIVTEETGVLISSHPTDREVAGAIHRFSQSDKNTFVFRNKVREYWQTHFNAQTNYQKFAEEIISNES